MGEEEAKVPEDLVTVEQACVQTGAYMNKIRWWVRRGFIGSARGQYGRLLVSSAEVAAYLKREALLNWRPAKKAQ